MCHLFFFFFSSRRRHTRLQGDWSSDVCSSDLVMSMLSLIASRKRWLFASAGQDLMNARLPGRFLVNSGTNEHPLKRASESAASGSLFKITRLEDRMAARLRGSNAFRKCPPAKSRARPFTAYSPL